MLLKNITTGVHYEVPKDVYESMERATKGKFQIINELDAEQIPVQKIEGITNKKPKTKKPKKENL